MASPSWILHVETFVDPDRPAPQQAASRDALVDLLVHNNVSISEIVKQMGEFLTTTDTTIRARGILLLGELWTELGGQTLADTVLHTFAAFFASRLADWHALRGALVGSLALLKREKSVGSVQEEDAKLFVESALVNLEVQALAQQDRMFCLELYECLLLQHARAVTSVGDRVVDGVCAAVDGEKDPRCLLVAFHVVELVAKLFPDPDGPVGNLAEDLFSIMSCYFPISFNPPPDDTRGITREDLSMALMRCFASTKLFADFCISLLLEKLSSSLRTAKRDSLKYMGYCSVNYGPEIFKQNAETIWNALKKELFPSQKPEAMDQEERDEEIAMEALGCFTSCIRASQGQSEGMAEQMDGGIFLQLVLKDVFVDDFFKCLPSVLVHKDCNDIPFTSSRDIDLGPSGGVSTTNNRAMVNIKETSRLLAAGVKASCSSCFVILDTVFKHIFEVAKVPIDIREADLLAFLRGNLLQHNLYFTGSLNVTVLEAVLVIIEAARKMAEDYINSFLSSSVDIRWMAPLQACGAEVVMAFALVIVAGLQNFFVGGSLMFEKIWEIGVAGLQAVASFPPQISAISEEQFQFVASFLLGIILEKVQVKQLWERAVEALAAICNVEEKFDACRQGLTDLVTGALLTEVLKDRPSLPVALSLKALAVVCSQRQLPPTGILKKLTEMLCDNLRAAVQQRECDRASEKAFSILQGLSLDFLPSSASTESENEAMLQLALGVWSVTEILPASVAFADFQILEASMRVLRMAISKCSEDSQRVFLSKTLDIFICISSTLPNYTSPQDVWVMGLFLSVLIPLRPSIHTFQERGLLPMVLATAVCPPCPSLANVAAEAVGSMLNKWYTQTLKVDDDASFNATINMIMKGEWMPKDVNFKHSRSDTEKPCSLHMKEGPLQVKLRGIHLLALIGKGLAMKGHVAVSDIAMLILRLIYCDDSSSIRWQDDALLSAFWPDVEEVSAISFAAAESLGFILRDSETSLNKEHFAVIKPLYKQRFFVSMLSPLSLAIKEAGMPGRVMLYHAFGNLVSAVPSVVLLTEAAKVLPLLLESLSVLCNDQRHSDVLLSILLALSALLVNKNVWDISSQHVATIANRLLALIQYPFSMMVRETALLCLGAVVPLPYARVFPVRTQVLRALTNALDDPKRTVRREAIRCRRAWDAITR